MQRKCGLDWLEDDQHLRNFGIVDEVSSVFDRWALAEENVVPAIWRGLNGENTQQGRFDHNAGLLQHLACAGLLPRLAEHLEATGQGKLSIALAGQSTPDHQEPSLQRYEHDNDRWCV